MLLRDFIILDSPMWIMKGWLAVFFLTEGSSPLINEAKLQRVWLEGWKPEWINDDCSPVN